MTFQLLTGNSDENTTMTYVLVPNIQARYIRINPQSFNNYIGMRIELIGCTQDESDFCKYTQTAL